MLVKFTCGIELILHMSSNEDVGVKIDSFVPFSKVIVLYVQHIENIQY